MQVIIIGTGKMATFLCKTILKTSHELIAIVGRNAEKVNLLSQQFNCNGLVNAYNDLPKADLIIIAVNDASIEKVAISIVNTNAIVLHTAGAVSKDVLQTSSNKYGVLWPIQSIHATTITNDGIPFVIDGNSEETIAIIQQFAESISSSITILNDEKRKKLHLAAVIVNNFTNHLYSLVDDFCKQEQISFDLLKAIIAETSEQIKYQHPRETQTGPAKRGDLQTIEKHVEILQNYPNIETIYRLMSDSIQKMHLT